MSPTYFDPESAVGGAERFAEELSRAASRHAAVRFVSFGARARRERTSASYERVILRSWTRRPLTPFSPLLPGTLRGAEVIHCHQYFVLPTFLAALQGWLQGSRVFVTDLGGGGWTPAYQLDQSRWITAQLALSQYAARRLPGPPLPHWVIYGGVDLERFRMRPGSVHDGSLVYLGRLLPHKGVHDAIAALPPSVTLHLLGSGPDAAYLQRLRELARGKDVRFRLAPSDAEVEERLQRAMALVHLTPGDADGSAGVNELFGLALVEAMACGCPVVSSAVASLPEIVVHGQTGLLLPPGRPESLAPALDRLRDFDTWAAFSAAGRQRVEELFTWQAVARRCFEGYAASGPRRCARAQPSTREG